MSFSNVPVPTLTEVVHVEPDDPQSVAPAAVDEAQLTQRVLADVQRQIDLMLEFRLREALAPAMARLTNSLIQEARNELAATLRDVVQRAVAQEIARQRVR